MIRNITVDNLIIRTVLKVMNLYFAGESSLCLYDVFSVTELGNSDLSGLLYKRKRLCKYFKKPVQCLKVHI